MFVSLTKVGVLTLSAIVQLVVFAYNAAGRDSVPSEVIFLITTPIMALETKISFIF
jgi:hypothetical protein